MKTKGEQGELIANCLDYYIEETLDSISKECLLVSKIRKMQSDGFKLNIDKLIKLKLLIEKVDTLNSIKRVLLSHDIVELN